MKTLTLLSVTFLGLLSLNAAAATVDGSIDASEYRWNTNGVEGSSKWETFTYADHTNNELNDSDGGDPWDIRFFGTNVSNGKFQFGAIGGDILSGYKIGESSVTGEGIYLSDFAISINNPSADPSLDSSAFTFAIRLVDISDATGGVANFELLKFIDTVSSWDAVNIYNHGANDPTNKSETYKMVGGSVVTTFTGEWRNNGGNNSVLEGEFDLNALLGQSASGSIISTYLTMACVNDEVLVHADLAAVPVPAALWLFAPALAGFMGLRRRVKTSI